MKRSPSHVLLAILLGGIFGSVLSYFLGGLFREGAVRQFFFQHVDFGIPASALKLGFLTFTFGLNISVTAFTVIMIALLVWLAGKL